jgi:hypothetical protein
MNAVVCSLGHLTGAGTIDARDNLDFKMVAALTNPPGSSTGIAVATAGALNDVLGMLTGSDAGSSPSKGERIPFLVQGTTSDPKFVPDANGFALQMLKEQLGVHLFKTKQP